MASYLSSHKSIGTLKEIWEQRVFILAIEHVSLNIFIRVPLVSWLSKIGKTLIDSC